MVIVAAVRDGVRVPCRETGWRLRVYTSYGTDSPPTDVELRRVWRLEGRTAVVAFNPSNPSLTSFYWLGDDVLAKLRRPFWQELQARYGNIFYIRDQVGGGGLGWAQQHAAGQLPAGSDLAQHPAGSAGHVPPQFSRTALSEDYSCAGQIAMAAHACCW